MRILITGGAGFIGSAVARRIIETGDDEVLVYDKLTHAGNLASLRRAAHDRRFAFVQADICDRAAVERAFAEFQPEIIMHLAAESHVDRAIDGPAAFIETNLVGTFTMLEAALDYWRKLSRENAARFRFMHISTDEVFGSLGPDGFFHEETPYAANSPYSASKAGSDHLVRAWRYTCGLPTIVTNCPNNYGPYHFPEKLIPLTIIDAIEEKPLPVYERGENIRDWLFVEDHAAALILVARQGVVGESYNVGGRNEWRDIDVVGAICDLMDEFRPRGAGDTATSLLSLWIAPDAICVTRSTARRSNANSAGVRVRNSKPACARRCVGISTIPTGGERSARASIGASGLASLLGTI